MTNIDYTLKTERIFVPLSHIMAMWILSSSRSFSIRIFRTSNIIVRSPNSDPTNLQGSTLLSVVPYCGDLTRADCATSPPMYIFGILIPPKSMHGINRQYLHVISFPVNFAIKTTKLTKKNIVDEDRLSPATPEDRVRTLTRLVQT